MLKMNKSLRRLALRFREEPEETYRNSTDTIHHILKPKGEEK